MAKAPEWLTRVESWRASGKSAGEFCKGRDYTAKNLHWWSSHFRRHGMPVSAAPQEKRVPLARVVRAPNRDGLRAAPIVIAIGDARVEVPAGFDHAQLGAVLDSVFVAVGRGRS